MSQVLDVEIRQVCEFIRNKDILATLKEKVDKTEEDKKLMEELELKVVNEPKDLKKNMIISNFEKEWIRIMAYSGLYNKVCYTYSLNNVEFKDYGLRADIYIVPPLTFGKLEELRDMLQENLGCMIILNHAKTGRWINAKFIYNQFDSKNFEVVKQQYPFMLYIGNDYSGEPVFVNLKDYPHLLISGGTRSGKSKMEDCIICNAVVNFKPTEIQLYLCQAAKSDLVLYEDLVHTRAFADNLEKIKQVLVYITDVVMPERDKMIRQYRKKALADNYHDYNQLKHTEKIPTTLIIFDEMSSLYQINGEGGDEKYLKQDITELIDRIAQYGSALGCFLISSVQRPTVKNLSPFVKSQSTANVSFRQNNKKSAEVATDDANLPLGLKQREFVYFLDNWEYGIVPWVNNKKVYNYIKPFLDPTHRTLFDDLEKMQHRDGVKKDKEKMEDVGTHIKTDKEILDEGISKIKDYVPYDNHNGYTIVTEEELRKRKAQEKEAKENELKEVEGKRLITDGKEKIG